VIDYEEFIPLAVDIMKEIDSRATEEYAAGEGEELKDLSEYDDETLHSYCTELFKIGDLNGDGVLSPEEIRTLLSLSGFDLSESQISTIVANADVNGDGVIDYEEFIPLAVDIMKELDNADTEEETEALKDISEYDEDTLKAYCTELFSIGDVNGDGVLSPEELRELLALSGFQLRDAQISAIVARADVNMDGVVDYEEFIPLAVDIMKEIDSSESGHAVAVEENEEFQVPRMGMQEQLSTALAELEPGKSIDTLQSYTRFNPDSFTQPASYACLRRDVREEPEFFYSHPIVPKETVQSLRTMLENLGAVALLLAKDPEQPQGVPGFEAVDAPSWAVAQPSTSSHLQLIRELERAGLSVDLWLKCLGVLGANLAPMSKELEAAYEELENIHRKFRRDKPFNFHLFDTRMMRVRDVFQSAFVPWPVTQLVVLGLQHQSMAVRVEAAIAAKSMVSASVSYSDVMCSLLNHVTMEEHLVPRLFENSEYTHLVEMIQKLQTVQLSAAVSSRDSHLEAMKARQRIDELYREIEKASESYWRYSKACDARRA